MDTELKTLKNKISTVEEELKEERAKLREERAMNMKERHFLESEINGIWYLFIVNES